MFSKNETASAFVRYLQPHWRRLYSVALRYAANEHDAHDLVQESLTRAWRNFSLAEEHTHSRSWLFVILRNVAAEWYRSSKRRVRLVPFTDAELTDLAPADTSASFPPLAPMDESRFREFLDQRLAGALDELEPAFREVVVLSVAGDLSYREVAEVLDCPVGTVMSRMARARRSIRERLADFAKAEGWVARKK